MNQKSTHALFFLLFSAAASSAVYADTLNQNGGMPEPYPTTTTTPSPYPTMTPTYTPTPYPTMTPTYTPTPYPTMTPTYTPTPYPTTTPTPYPTTTPTPYPTHTPYPGDQWSERRLDCKFKGHEEHRHTCRASATYYVNERTKDIKRIHYGVECDHYTIYDGKATIEPQETVADHIRPETAAIPLVQLNQQNDLRFVGSYDAELEVDWGKQIYGHCYVTKDDDDGGWAQ